MTLLEGLIVETLVSGTLTATLRKSDERAQIQAALMDWEIDAKPTPWLDSVLEDHAGTPETKKESILGRTIVSMTRALVNRRFFEHLVQGCVNQNSKLRERFTFLERLTNGKGA